jgi:hypothetical protein
MATLEQIGAALKRAAAAGDTAAATKLAKAYKAMQAQGAAPQAQPQAAPTPPAPTAPPQSLGDQLSAGFTSGVNAHPDCIGPSVLGGLENLKGMVQGRSPADVHASDQAQTELNPVASTVGSVAGNVLPFMAGGEIPMLAKGLGMDASMPFLMRSLAAGGSTAAISGADTLARGGNPLQAAQDAGIGGAVGAMLPGLGVAARGIAKTAPKVIDWTLGGLPSMGRAGLNTTKAAQKAVGRAMAADRSAGQAMTPAEDAAAVANGLPLINLDRGGPATRRLARVSGNTQEAKATLEGAVDRGPPGMEAAGFLTNLVGGSADDLALKEGLRNTSRLVNAPAYRKAYSSPAAQSIWSPDLGNMFQSDQFKKAVQGAESIGRTRAAIGGGKGVQNPFVFHPDGSVTMKPGVTPTLEFWDKVKINLDRQIEALNPNQRSEIADLTALKQKLVGTLDGAVPEYRAARQGAAAFFGADDALEAGRKFALQPRNLPEAMKAFAAMSDVDKKAFRIGAASSAVDKLKAGNDSFAVVKSTFGNQAAREFWQAVLGPSKAAQLESYVKVQAIMDASKRAIQGGSHTYDLMLAGGLGAAGATGSYFAPGNNFSTAAYLLAALRGGRSVLGRKIDQQIGEQVANLLASGDKAALNKVVANASMSPKWQAALDAIMRGMAAGSRGLAVGGGTQQPMAHAN